MKPPNHSLAGRLGPYTDRRTGTTTNCHLTLLRQQVTPSDGLAPESAPGAAEQHLPYRVGVMAALVSVAKEAETGNFGKQN